MSVAESPRKREISPTLATQLLDYTRNKAKEMGLLNEQELSRYIALRKTAAEFDSDSKTADKDLLALVQKTSEVTPGWRLAMSHLMTAESIVLNSLSNMDRAKMTDDPYTRFMNLFKRGLEEGQDKNAFIELLHQAKEQMVIRIVETAHPVVYHTAFAREAEKRLTQQLEAVNSAADRFATIPDSEQMRAIKGSIDALLTGIQKEGKKLTPNIQVTVPQENEAEQQNFKVRQEMAASVVEAYNRALDDVIEGKDRRKDKNESRVELGKDQRMRLNACKLDKSPFVDAVWTRASDADGRDKATSIELYKSVRSSVVDGKYTGPKLDCRENSEIHRNFISALVQTRYWISDHSHGQASEFKKFCEDFCKERQPETKKGSTWDLPSNSILQQLDEEDQAEFIRRLIINDRVKLVPNKVRDTVLDFNPKFWSLYREFVNEHWDLIHQQHPHLEKNSVVLEDLRDVWLIDKAKYPQYEDGIDLARLLRNKVRETLRSDKSKYPFRLNGDFSYTLADGDITEEYLNRRMKVEIREDSKGKPVAEHEELEDAERKKLMDVVKRLYILDDAIKTYGPSVSDRYQIANFEKASDFYGTLLLFKEAGIVTVKDGKVVNDPAPKLSLQPLLETANDMRNAPEMFRKLLEDPLVLSYYQARGNKADIMLGFSDGSKSAGNFASEWNIYKCAREMKKVFAEKGIKVQVFQGRGRGPDRGGHFEEGYDQHMMPPEIQEDMILDVTLQGDKPMDMRISSAEASNTLASMIGGTITAKKSADSLLEKKLALVTDKNPVRGEMPQQTQARILEQAERAWEATPEGKSRRSIEAAIEFIATQSEKTYCDYVSKEPKGKALEFLNNMYSSKLISSRKPKRGATAKGDFDSTRAITVEYGYGFANVTVHNIGLKTALETFAKEGPEVFDAEGKALKGEAALKYMYNENAFFRGAVDKISHGMNNYKAPVFQAHAKAMSVEDNSINDWAQKVSGELDGLTKELQHIRIQPEKKPAGWKDKTQRTGATDIQMRKQIEYSARRSEEIHHLREGNGTLASAMALSLAMEDGEIKPRKGVFKPAKGTEDWETLNNAMFVKAERLSHRGIPPEMVAQVDGYQWVH